MSALTREVFLADVPFGNRYSMDPNLGPCIPRDPAAGLAAEGVPTAFGGWEPDGYYYMPQQFSPTPIDNFTQDALANVAHQAPWTELAPVAMDENVAIAGLQAEKAAFAAMNHATIPDTDSVSGMPTEVELPDPMDGFQGECVVGSIDDFGG